MRYYHPFPEAIPLSEAGCSRVTHPSATMLLKQAPITPFDLHVLGVPPAFVLSQDQTLHRVVSPIRFYSDLKSGSLRIARNYCLRFIVLSDFSKYNTELISKLRIDQGFQFFLPFLFSHCSVFKMQISSAFGSFYLVKRLVYYTTLSGFCQAFFQSFLKFFSRSCGFSDSLVCCISRSAYKLYYYTTFLIACQEVFQIFSNLFSRRFVVFIVPAPLCDSRPAW